MSEKPTPGQAITVLAVIMLVAALCKIAWAVYAYDDWTCAWAECRKVKP